MVFDSSQAKMLLEAYSSVPDFLVPYSVVLSRSEEYAEERNYLEKCLEKVSIIKKQEWISRLFSKDDRQHISVWFEIMLFGWLSKISYAEAIDKDGYPDFSLMNDDQEIMIEARAILIDEKHRNEDRFVGGLFSLLKKVKRQFMIEVHRFTVGSAFLSENFVSEVTDWLDNYPNQFFEYQDKYDNKVMLSAKYSSEFPHVVATYSPGAVAITGLPLKRPLKEKAAKYKPIRHSSTPYVIAVFLENFLLGAEEIVEAWFGRTKYIIDVNTSKIVDQKSDLSGIHFLGKEVVHKTVSGTLVFKANFNSELGRRELIGWWIENPFAKNLLHLDNFPLKARYIVTEKTRDSFKMAWQK